MDMSESVSEIFTALSKFQGELSNAFKSKSGHGYNYADLAACIDAAKDPLSKNGLAITQMMGISDKGPTLITMLTHSSGQWIRSEFVMAQAVLQGGGGRNPAQVMGSAITYMRRYAYAAIIGLAQTDDDAAMVSQSDATLEELQHAISQTPYSAEQVCQSFNVPNLAKIKNRTEAITTIKGWK